MPLVTNQRQYRMVGESPQADAQTVKDLALLAKREAYPDLRRELASTAIALGRRLDTTSLVHALLEHKEDTRDPVIPQMLWLAYEPKLTSAAKSELDWLKDNATGNALVTETIVPRTMRKALGSRNRRELQFAPIASA